MCEIGYLSGIVAALRRLFSVVTNKVAIHRSISERGEKDEQQLLEG